MPGSAKTARSEPDSSDAITQEKPECCTRYEPNAMPMALMTALMASGSLGSDATQAAHTRSRTSGDRGGDGILGAEDGCEIGSGRELAVEP